MEPFPLTLASNQLVGFDCGVDKWIFADASYIPSFWLVLKRESFNQYSVITTEPIDFLFHKFDVEALAQIYRLYDILPADSSNWGKWTYRRKIQHLVMSGFIKVFKVSDATAQRLGSYNDTINSDPYLVSLSSNPIDVKRNELAEELGNDIASRWIGKDAADRLHFQRWMITRHFIENWDRDKAAIDMVGDMIGGLKDMAVMIVTLAGDDIEFSLKIYHGAIKAGWNSLTGDQQAALETLAKMELLKEGYNNDKQALVDNMLIKAEEGYKMFMRLKDDPHSRTLMWDYFISLYDSLSYREQQTTKKRIVLEVGIEVLLAIATAGAANAIRRGAQAAATAVRVTKGVGTTQRVGPFTLIAIDHMADLSKLLNKPAVKPPQKPPMRVVPEGDAYDASKQRELSARAKEDTIDQGDSGGKVKADSVFQNSIKPVVTAEARVGGSVFNDVNQTARAGASSDQLTLIADRVALKSAQSGKVLPNANMGTAHAEVGAIQQAFDAGATAGANMSLKVTGKAVCGYCRGDVAAMAKQADLKSLTVFEEATGNTLYWEQGMKSLKKAK